jgi:hypothetical protein
VEAYWLHHLAIVASFQNRTSNLPVGLPHPCAHKLKKSSISQRVPSVDLFAGRWLPAAKDDNGIRDPLPRPPAGHVAVAEGLIGTLAGFEFSVLAVVIHQQLSCPPNVYVFHGLATP